MTVGVLPKQQLRRLMTDGHIEGVDQGCLNPASIDLPLSGEAYRIDRSFLPQVHQTVREWFPHANAIRHPLGTPLEKGVTYLIRVDGRWQLPKRIYGFANPKSSTGRLGFFCQVIADAVPTYEYLPEDWYGELWMLVRPGYFSIRVGEGQRLAQMRFFSASAFLNTQALKNEIKGHGLTFDPSGRKLAFSQVEMHRDSLYLTLAIQPHMGWVTRTDCREILDYGGIGTHDPFAFFEPVGSSHGRFNLDEGRLYILSTEERVMVAEHLSAELRAIDPRLGLFLSHAAGYIDPGWGWGKGGEVCGRPITLEVVPFVDMTVQRGQRIARIRYERMAEIPEVLYDAAESNYTEQKGAKLSKHFRPLEHSLGRRLIRVPGPKGSAANAYRKPRFKAKFKKQKPRR